MLFPIAWPLQFTSWKRSEDSTNKQRTAMRIYTHYIHTPHIKYIYVTYTYIHSKQTGGFRVTWWIRIGGGLIYSSQALKDFDEILTSASYKWAWQSTSHTFNTVIDSLAKCRESFPKDASSDEFQRDSSSQWWIVLWELKSCGRWIVFDLL